LKNVDTQKAIEFDNSLKHLGDNSFTSLDYPHNHYQLLYLLLKERINTQALMESYSRHSELLYTKEKNLWKFAIDSADSFIDEVTDQLSVFFEDMKVIILSELQDKYHWYSSFDDSIKKAGKLVNSSMNIISHGLEKIGKDVISAEKHIHTNSIVEDLFEKHFDKKLVEKVLGSIFEKAYNNFCKRWQKEIQIQSPQITMLDSHLKSDFLGLENCPVVDTPEKVLAIGFSGALIGTFALASGWHTLAYSMANVFPPIAIFTVITSLAAAKMGKKKALQDRKKIIVETINKMHKHYLLQIEIHKFEELDNLTLRETINNKSKTVIEETVKQWNIAICGNLISEHYKEIISAFKLHLVHIDNCISCLEDI
jgi:hypothetical protein